MINVFTVVLKLYFRNHFAGISTEILKSDSLGKRFPTVIAAQDTGQHRALRPHGKCFCHQDFMAED